MPQQEALEKNKPSAIAQNSFFGKSAMNNFFLQKQTPAQQTALPQFTADHFVSGNFPNFNVQYDVEGPAPKTGTLWIFHKVFINYPSSMDAAERKTFEDDFKKSIHEIWSEKFLIKLNEPGFSPYQCNVEVFSEIVDKKKDAHTVINVKEEKKDSKRFRSNVKGIDKTKGSATTHVATLDSRDPTVPDKTGQSDIVENIWQIKDFAFDSAEMNTDTTAATNEVVSKIKPLVNDEADDSLLKKPRNFVLYGRASSQGNKEYNKKLGERRANAVAEKIKTDLGKADKKITIQTPGEENATHESKFRRVDAVLVNATKQNLNTEQNTAAHEFGHMIGFSDEYIEENPDPGGKKKFGGDKTDDYDFIKDTVGKDAADEMIIKNSSNIMAKGNVVKKGHYAYFVDALNKMTGKKWNI